MMASMIFKGIAKRKVAGLLAAHPGLRRWLIETTRHVGAISRLDFTNQMECNGELLVQERALRELRQAERLVILDVGANIGDWTRRLLALAATLDLGTLEIHAFEACPGTYQMLTRNLTQCDPRHCVHAVPKALSSKVGSATFYSRGDGGVANSLESFFGNPGEASTVETTTVDDYCLGNRIERIQLLKIDTEGHDLSVIEGSTQMLQRGSIGLLQFEYNHRWISSRHYLRDAFELLQPFGYHVGKITLSGIEFYHNWQPELESYVEGNYLACRDEWVAKLPVVPWWKS